MFVSVRVKDGGSTVLPWTISHMEIEATFTSLYTSIVLANDIAQQYSNTSCIRAVYVGDSRLNQAIEANMESVNGTN